MHFLIKSDFRSCFLFFYSFSFRKENDSRRNGNFPSYSSRIRPLFLILNLIIKSQKETEQSIVHELLEAAHDGNLVTLKRLLSVGANKDYVNEVCFFGGKGARSFYFNCSPTLEMKLLHSPNFVMFILHYSLLLSLISDRIYSK